MQTYIFTLKALRGKLALFLVLAPATLWVGAVFSQKTTVRRDRGLAAQIITYAEIPEATEPCNPEICQWWNQLRRAGNDLQRKSDEKSKRIYALLFSEGLQRGYRVPLRDRPPQVLVFGRVAYSNEVIKLALLKRVNKTAILSVEFRRDGSIGDVKLVEGLGSRMDENVIEAARQNVFLPAIKDGGFVTEWGNTEFTFSTRRNPDVLKKFR